MKVAPARPFHNEGGKPERREEGVARCQVLTVTGHPIAKETWVRGHAGEEEGRSGRARAPSSGAAGAFLA